MYTRRSWQEKMDNPTLPKVVDIPLNWRKWAGRGRMLIASPHQVDALIRTVRKGRLITISRIREILAGQHMTDTTCPLTTGIFVRIAAEAAEEAAQAGKTHITPYWRVVKDDGSLNPKFPGGVSSQAEKLRAEGHRILPAKGKRPPRVAEIVLE
jgi:alkylated DNA nucleotide flippase Atl1